MRLDRILSEMNSGSRKEIKEKIRKGLVTVNGDVVKDPAFKTTFEDSISISGQKIVPEEKQYFIMNKPAGFICATKAYKEGTRLVTTLLPENSRKDIFPVGRLDLDTVGLLLLSNDGNMAHRMLSPGSHVEKTYFVKVKGIIDENDVKAFKEGFSYDKDLFSLPAGLKILNLNKEEGWSEAEIVIHEGKFHQIKKMFLARGKEVIYLKRTGFGPLTLPDDLLEGQARKLNNYEFGLLKPFIKD